MVRHVHVCATEIANITEEPLYSRHPKDVQLEVS